MTTARTDASSRDDGRETARALWSLRMVLAEIDSLCGAEEGGQGATTLAVSGTRRGSGHMDKGQAVQQDGSLQLKLVLTDTTGRTFWCYLHIAQAGVLGFLLPRRAACTRLACFCATTLLCDDVRLPSPSTAPASSANSFIASSPVLSSLPPLPYRAPTLLGL